MTRSLPWSIALHLLLAGAIIAAGGNSALRKDRFLPGAFVVELKQAASGLDKSKPAAVPSTENISQAKAVPVEKEKEKEKEKAQKPDAVTAKGKAASRKVMAETAKETPSARKSASGPGAAPALAPAQSPGARQRAALFQNMAVRRSMGMWRPSHMMWRAPVLPNPWFDASMETLFLSAVHTSLKSILAQKVGKPGAANLGGQAAKVLLSYGAGGKKLAAAAVSSGSDELKALLQGINWQAAPLPGVYGLSLKGLAITIKVGSGVTVTEKAL